jgi:hypothetical protein
VVIENWRIEYNTRRRHSRREWRLSGRLRLPPIRHSQTLFSRRLCYKLSHTPGTKTPSGHSVSVVRLHHHPIALQWLPVQPIRSWFTLARATLSWCGRTPVTPTTILLLILGPPLEVPRMARARKSVGTPLSWQQVAIQFQRAWMMGAAARRIAQLRSALNRGLIDRLP